MAIFLFIINNLLNTFFVKKIKLKSLFKKIFFTIFDIDPHFSINSAVIKKVFALTFLFLNIEESVYIQAIKAVQIKSLSLNLKYLNNLYKTIVVEVSCDSIKLISQ
jgi:hypothetical protein